VFLQHLTVNRSDLQNHLPGFLKALIYCFSSFAEVLVPSHFWLVRKAQLLPFAEMSNVWSNSSAFPQGWQADDVYFLQPI